MPQSYQSFAPPRGDAYSATANGVAPSDGQQQVNGLFLLSQAHQELAKREEAQRASSSSLNGEGAAINPQSATGVQRRAPKRKSTEVSAPAQPVPVTRNSNKKPRAAANAANKKRGKRGDSMSDEEDDEDDDMDSDMDMGMPTGPATKGSRKPETEEEKRRNFLERNRQGTQFSAGARQTMLTLLLAALKCRQRKKAWLAQLQAKVEFLTTENERLNAALLKSSEEINRLTALVTGGNVVPSSGNVAGGSVGMAHKNEHTNGALPMATVVGGGRGYGY